VGAILGSLINWKRGGRT